jgi:hypothetical protein
VEEGFGVSAQVLVPSQVRVMQAVSVQVMAVPPQVEPEQVSPQVQALPSSQPAAVRQAQVPLALVQR